MLKIGDIVKVRGSNVIGEIMDIFSDYGIITNAKAQIVYIQVKIESREFPMVYQIDEVKKIEESK